MKIGHYTLALWMRGGVASYIRRVSDGQRRLGHEIVYLDTVLPTDGAATQEEAVEYVQDPTQLYSAAAALGVDILHVHAVLPEGVQPTLPTIRTVHGHEPYCPSGSRFLKRTSQSCNRTYSLLGCTWNYFAQRCGSIRPQQMKPNFQRTWQEMRTLSHIPSVTVSHFLKEQMVRAGYPEGNIHVLHLPALEVKQVVPPPREGVPRFVFLGRITPSKGVDWLLRAVRHVQTPMHLDIAGSGDLEPEMRRLAEQLGLSGRVTFHGWVSGDQVNQLLSQARAVVFPSVWHEPAGFVTLDAAMNARAVIASRVGGIPEYAIDGQTALTVAPNNMDDLAGAIEQLAGDWDLARRLGDAGRQNAAELFTLTGHIATLMGLYEECLSVHSAPMDGKTAFTLPMVGPAQRRTIQHP